MMRLVLADDHAIVREGIRGLLQARMPEIEIAAEASTGIETLAACRAHHPDLLLLDISMPELGGLEVLGELASASPRTRTVILSQYDDRAYVIRAFRLGAKAYVLKRAMAKDLVAALRAVMEGRTYVDSAVADAVVDAAVNPGVGDGESELGRLTQREREVLRLTAEGKIAKEVAQVLGISEHTVNRHRANLMEKLGLHGKADLVKAALKLKLIAMP